MKEKLLNTASRFIILNLAFLPMLPVMRLAEYFFLSSTPDFPANAFSVEALGLIHDLFSLTVFAMVMLIPFTVIYHFHKKAGVIFYIVILWVLTVVQLALIRFFSITLSPLDEVIFSFSFKEIMMIIRSTDDLNLISFLPMIVAVLLLLILQFLFRKISIARVLLYSAAGFAVAAILFSMILPSGSVKDEPDYSYYLKVNKCGYFVKSSIGSLFRSSSIERSEKVVKEIEKYQSVHHEFNFTGDNYPLFHAGNTPNALGPFFRLSPRPPNLVFIIVESLSSACVGDSSWYGNFTPFLDSLKNHSLYWDNFLSTSERTFHVLQALFGSLPYGRGEFQKDMAVMPNHFSLIRYLRDNGYYSGFYYGGDASFTGYDQFLKKQGLDFLLRYFGPKYEKMQLEYKNFRWGYHDEAVFERSMEALDSLKKEPRMDIYLTLSTHLPFRPPRAASYLKQVENILNKPGFPLYQKTRSAPFKELFSSMLYTDDALRSLIKAYSKRDDFNNTIFIITGDHCFTEFGNSSISAIEHYHVPMIIYSPLLKEARHFQSVSSHLDITPSLLAMLSPVYNFKSEKYSHWLGQGIDTAMGFRNIRTMAFTRKNNKTEDYLKNDYYYSGGNLYKIRKGLRTIPVNDDLKRQEMSDELKTTVTVYNYTNQNNLLLPPNLYLPVRLDQELILSFDTAILKISTPEQKFLNLITPAEFKSKYLNLFVDIRFRYMISEPTDTSKFPLLTASIEDNKFKQSLYHRFKFPGIPSAQVKPDKWYSMNLYENMDVSQIDSLKGKYLKLYFYYEQPYKIQFMNIEVRLRGIK